MPCNDRVETVVIYVDVVDSARVETCHHIESVGYRNGIHNTRSRGKVDRVVLHIPDDVGTACVGPGYAKTVETGVRHMQLFGGTAGHLIQHDVVDIGSVYWRLERRLEGDVSVGASVSGHPHRMVRIVAKRFDMDGVHSNEGIGVARVAHHTYHYE